MNELCTKCRLSPLTLSASVCLSCSLFVPDVTLCEEAVFQSLASLRLPSMPLERLLESLPGRKVEHKNLERLKKACTPQKQVLLLLRLWREQNKDQDKLYGIIQGTDRIHAGVSFLHCTSLCFNMSTLSLQV